MMNLLMDTYISFQKIVNSQPACFSGIGLVVYNSLSFDRSSHSDLRPGYKAPDYHVGNDQFYRFLAEISDYHNTFHDGFHMVDETGTLRYIAQYFVPPVVASLGPNQEHGVRLHSARCGSTLKGVIFIAVISSNFEVHFFKDGNAINLTDMEMNYYV